MAQFYLKPFEASTLMFSQHKTAVRSFFGAFGPVFFVHFFGQPLETEPAPKGTEPRRPVPRVLAGDRPERRRLTRSITSQG